MGESDEAAVARARAGDPEGFRVLVERHSHALFRLAYRMTGNEQDAEDVVQEAFLRAYRRLDRYESRAGFGTWLYRITVNCSLDLIRRRLLERRDPAAGDASETMKSIPAGEPGPDRLAFGVEVRHKVALALAELSPKERVAFVLRHFEGRSIDEISRAMGGRPDAAKNCIFRAVQKLRRALDPLMSTAL